MGKKRGRHRSIWQTRATEEPAPYPLDLQALGSGMKRLPPVYWEPQMFFQGALDLRLQEATGVFPATLRPDRKTHPLFVLEAIDGLGHRVCPCSSRNWAARRFIREGCVLEYTGRVTDRNSYLVEACTFNMPLDPDFWQPLLFMGLVPTECLGWCGP